MKKSFVISILILIGICVGTYAVLQRSKSTPEPTKTQTQQNSNKSPDSTANPQGSDNRQPQQTTPKTYPVKVYFSKHSDSDDDQSKVFAVERTSPDLGVAQFSITELLKGPTAAETSAGYFSTAKIRESESNCGGADFKITVANTVATLQFCRTFDHIGVMSDGQAESEIIATLLQFDTIKKVIILNRSGDCEFNLSGLNLCKQ